MMGLIEHELGIEKIMRSSSFFNRMDYVVIRCLGKLKCSISNVNLDEAYSFYVKASWVRQGQGEIDWPIIRGMRPLSRQRTPMTV